MDPEPQRMAELKTRETEASVDDFIAAVQDDARRADCLRLVGMMREVTGAEPRMWGSSMVGFGRYDYRYASGHVGRWFLTGFSPRKRDLTLYIMSGFDRYDSLMARLGRYRTGKSCLYVKRLDDVDPEVLRELIAASVEHVERRHGAG